jgi:hypothetical protein
MGSVGAQPDEPSLEEKLGMDEQQGPVPDTNDKAVENAQQSRH